MENTRTAPQDQRRPGSKQGLRRDTGDVADATARLVRAVGRRVALEDVEALTELVELKAAVDAAFADAINGYTKRDGTVVAGLRSQVADREIGEVLGITRQAVEQRWPSTTDRRKRRAGQRDQAPTS